MFAADDCLCSALLQFPEPLFILDKDLQVSLCNYAFLQLLGWDPELGALPKTTDFWPSFDEQQLSAPEVIADLQIGAGKENFNLMIIELAGGSRLVRVMPEPGISRERHFHSQRLRTLGMLAGGIAHDFNNVLAGILGHITYLKTILPEAGPHVESLAAIEEGGKKASQMTQQILNFSKLETAERPNRINLSDLVVKTWGLLRGALSPEYNLQYRLPPKPLYVMAVEGRLAQVIVNLAINSRDALEHGGDILISVEPCEDSAELRRVLSHEPKLASYAVLRVTDNGKGMAPTVLRRVFEPYFSTKKNKGTGLGLSTVQTIVRSSGGVIDIQSATDRGTMVSIFLPSIEGSEETKPASQGRVPLTGGTERILIVDDEDPVRNVLCVSLAHLGYTVDIASSGAEAIDKIRESREPFDLVILDMLMPHLPGDEVFFRMKELHPDIRVLVISGYTSEEAVQRILENGGKGFIQKPFTIEDLSKKVRSCLDD